MTYHIPIPDLMPTVDELDWARQNLIPQALTALDSIYNKYGPKLDKVNFDQSVFANFTLANRMREHFNELGLTFRKFAIFLGYAGAKNARPHIDAHTVDVPLVARLNVPLQGQRGVRLSWWNATANDSRILAQRFEQWDGKLNQARIAFRYQSQPDVDWGTPDHVEYDPGPCWNHTELVHRLDLDNTTEHRINLTAEIQNQISWEDLVSRLGKIGYIS